MKLPNADQCVVDENKIEDYLLNAAHPVGRSKARFFLDLGFQPDSWRILADALRRHGAAGEVSASRNTRFGVLYVVVAPLQSPTESKRDVCTIWLVDSGGVAPRLVTAYPKKP